MTTYVAVVLVIVSRVVFGAGWVKVANFYRHTQTDLLTGYEKSGEDLIVLLVDTNGREVRLPLREVGYYETSQIWKQLNETLYFGRLSFFVRNQANLEIEHDIMRFEENMTIGSDHRSLMTLVNDGQTFSGYMCNMGKPLNVKKTAVFLCLHNVIEHGIDINLIVVVARQDICKGCPVYQLKPRQRETSLEFTLPESKHSRWNLTIEYRHSIDQHTKLCQISQELVTGDLHMVVMKPNQTGLTLYECVIFTEEIYYDELGMWVPIISGLACLTLIIMTAMIVYKKCDRTCLRQLMPTPDQDTAPYRSFNSSNPSDSPPARNNEGRYIKMKSLPSEVPETPAPLSTFLSRHSEQQYARI